MTIPDNALPQLIAHRGNAAEFPENTLQAFASAIELGARHVEFDVQLTADHVPVVIHDADLRRVAGRDLVVHEMNWADLAAIPVGEASRFGQQFAHTCAPSLAQTVDAIAAWPGVTAFVEVKRASLRRFGSDTVLTRIAEVLQPVLEKCVLISFDLTSVRILREMTRARVGWVLEQYDAAARRDAIAAAPEFLFLDIERVPDDATALWTGPWQWAVYEVRDLATARRCQSLGAAYVESMTVREMQAVLTAAGARR